MSYVSIRWILYRLRSTVKDEFWGYSVGLWDSIVPHIAIIAGFATSYESNSNELSLCSRVIQLSSQTNASLAFSDPRAF